MKKKVRSLLGSATVFDRPATASVEWDEFESPGGVPGPA